MQRAFFIALAFLIGGGAMLQAQVASEKSPPLPYAGIYDTTDVSELYPFTEGIFRIDIPRVVSRDIIVLVTDTTVFVPLFDLFSFLETPTTGLNNNKRIETRFPNDITIVIDIDKNLISIEGRDIPIRPEDYIFFNGDIFLDSRYFPRFFYSNLVVNINTLVIAVQSKLTFPVEERIRRSQRYANLRVVTPVAQRIDQHLDRLPHIFNGAMVDWGVGYNNTLNQFSYNGTVGTEILAGDFFGSINGFSGVPVQWSLMPWRWRYVEDQSPYFQQATIGNYQSSYGRMYSARGITVSNVPPYQRPLFGDYTYSGSTDPLSDVELYVNDRLMQYVTADSSGHFVFTFPMQYGGAILRVESYSKLGRARTFHDRIDIDNSYLSPGLSEYTFSAGELVPIWTQKAGQFNGKLGVTEDLTVGLGYSGIYWKEELHSSPMVQAAFRLFTRTNWLVEHVHNHYTRVQARYFDPSGFYAQASEAVGYDDSFWNYTRMLNEQRLSLGIPLRWIGNGASFNLSGIRMQSRMYQNLNLFTFFSQTFHRFSTSLSVNSSWFAQSGNFSSPNVTSALWVSVRLLPRVNFGTRLEHNSRFDAFTFFQNSLYVNILNNWYFTLSHYQNLLSGQGSLQLGINLRSPFAVFNTNSNYTDDRVGHSIAASGTIGYDSQVNNLLFHNMQWVGRSGLTIVPFLDANGNAAYENGEPLLISKVSATANRGALLPSGENGLTRFVGLDQYERIQVTVDPSSLTDPSWMPRYKTLEVTTDPNQFKPILLPVFFAGEVVGTVSKQTPGGLVGLRNMKVLLTNADSSFRDLVYTYSDGGFSYFGLPPGRYTAMIDTARARRLGLSGYPEVRSFIIASKPEGDLVGNVDFVLKPILVPGITERTEPPKDRDITKPGDTLGLIGRTELPIDSSRSLIQQPVTPDTSLIAGRTSLPDSTRDLTGQPDRLPTDSTAIAASKDLPPPGIIGKTDVPVPVPEKVEIPPEPVKYRELKSLTINLQKAGLDTTVSNYLDRVAQTIKTGKNLVVRIEGHSDNFGSFIQNQQRSQERAVRSRDYLIRKGVKSSAIVIQAFGSRKPIAPNNTAEGRARNNRIDITVAPR